MLINDKLPWSKRQLKKLGYALLSDGTVPQNCPDYDSVMLWHHELAAEVARVLRGAISNVNWNNGDITCHVTSRGKTVDTLIQKLERSSITLDVIQDLAGVRIDGNFNTAQQTQLAEALGKYFDVDERGFRDLRSTPHSGYRAFHLWLRLPAGRVEVQIRTEGQSEWANAYERLGDHLGRGIRYGEEADVPGAQEVVEAFHQLSFELAAIEHKVMMVHFAQTLPPDRIAKVIQTTPDPVQRAEFIELQQVLVDAESERQAIFTSHENYLVKMRRLRRMIEDLEEV
ncbi:hypothetical protein RQCS_40480 [Rhodococcus qingshengii]|uniref:hypothetical protein n=1 Tax=Rhodococcus qingshengii TaxID=334542 RepID=UPI0007E59750|nr:hypothetical protein [Rhodococcus qingshengii]BCF84503.1 hypothetical protein RQCS_40480 [Rhodococcus qingshengii]